MPRNPAGKFYAKISLNIRRNKMQGDVLRIAELTLMQIVEEMKDCKDVQELGVMLKDAQDALQCLYDSIKGELE
jgi:hypothetical protein